MRYRLADPSVLIVSLSTRIAAGQRISGGAIVKPQANYGAFLACLYDFCKFSFLLHSEFLLTMPFSPFTHSSRLIWGRVIVIVPLSWDATRPRHPSCSPSCRPLVVPPTLSLAALSSSLLLSLSLSCPLSLSPSRPLSPLPSLPLSFWVLPLVSVWVSACLREQERERVGLSVGPKVRVCYITISH